MRNAPLRGGGYWEKNEDDCVNRAKGGKKKRAGAGGRAGITSSKKKKKVTLDSILHLTARGSHYSGEFLGKGRVFFSYHEKKRRFEFGKRPLPRGRSKNPHIAKKGVSTTLPPAGRKERAHHDPVLGRKGEGVKPPAEPSESGRERGIYALGRKETGGKSMSGEHGEETQVRLFGGKESGTFERKEKNQGADAQFPLGEKKFIL